MTMNNKVSGVRCQVSGKQVPGAKRQVSGEKFGCFAFLYNLIPGTYHLKPITYNLKPITYNLPRGFTLIELIVVVGIITIITAVVLANNNKYGGSVLLQNLAYDIALSIRQAQVYGISVRSLGSSNFSVGYGMHFDISDPTHYELFADKNDDGFFTSDLDPALDENVSPSPYVIGRNYSIAKLCAPAGTDSSTCSSVNQLDIQYKRPEPDANISARTGTGGGTGQSCVKHSNQCQDSGRIVVQSPRGDILSIVVDATGQISVQ